MTAHKRRWVIWQSKLDESALVEFPRGFKPKPDDPDWERIEVVEVDAAEGAERSNA